MDDGVETRALEDLLIELESQAPSALSAKTEAGVYTYANDFWSELAEAPIHKIVGSVDHKLPWAKRNATFIRTMDEVTRREGYLKRVDRLVHFRKREWLHTTTERIFLAEEEAIVCKVSLAHKDEFCSLASQLTENGLTHNGFDLSIRQLYLLHQILFHVANEQTARELNCSTFRIHQELRGIREYFSVHSNADLLRSVSANGLFPLLEHFDVVFRQRWLPSELKFH